MRSPVILALLSLLAGCSVMTPAELRETRPVVVFDTRLPPLQAAQCLGRAAEEYPKFHPADRFLATWREGPTVAGYELLVRRTLSVPLLIADVAPRDSGSTVRMWEASAIGFSGDGDLSVVMAKGCR
jgi:hypothetical protein